ncbi:MAG: hypothetical protein HYZ57_14795 [Acidobacteria bacterium]|nr:hypothetical protein [Acidobacteriota bacterium]MBI3281100.1 hypothetical protein [Acidobacteriota bacterium]
MPKAQYTEAEAAELLGVSVEQLRALVQSHITRGEQDLDSSLTFQASDLLVLRVLAGLPISAVG